MCEEPSAISYQLILIVRLAQGGLDQLDCIARFPWVDWRRVASLKATGY
jgi:hypothetical protein